MKLFLVIFSVLNCYAQQKNSYELFLKSLFRTEKKIEFEYESKKKKEVIAFGPDDKRELSPISELMKLVFYQKGVKPNENYQIEKIDSQNYKARSLSSSEIINEYVYTLDKNVISKVVEKSPIGTSISHLEYQKYKGKYYIRSIKMKNFYGRQFQESKISIKYMAKRRTLVPLSITKKSFLKVLEQRSEKKTILSEKEHIQIKHIKFI